MLCPDPRDLLVRREFAPCCRGFGASHVCVFLGRQLDERLIFIIAGGRQYEPRDVVLRVCGKTPHRGDRAFQKLAHASRLTRLLILVEMRGALLAPGRRALAQASHDHRRLLLRAGALRGARHALQRDPLSLRRLPGARRGRRSSPGSAAARPSSRSSRAHRARMPPAPASRAASAATAAPPSPTPAPTCPTRSTSRRASLDRPEGVPPQDATQHRHRIGWIDTIASLPAFPSARGAP